MEDAKLNVQDEEEEEEEYHEALDDFPFYDCQDSFSEAIESCGDVSTTSVDDRTLPPPTLRRRRSHTQTKCSTADIINSSKLSSSVSLENYVNSRQRNSKLSRKIKEYELKRSCSSDSEGVKDSVAGENTRSNVECSSLTDASGGRGYADLVTYESNMGEDYVHRDASSSLLHLLSGLVLKAIRFQFDLSIKLFTFPIWLMYYLFMVVFNPLGLLKCGKRCLIRKIKRIWNLMSPFLYEWFKEHQAIWKFGLKCGWGLLWSIYVCVVLVGLLVLSFVIGGLLTRWVVEEPIRITRNLNFDYTEKSPVAFVPVIVEPELSHKICLAGKPETVKGGGSRAIPANHKLQVTVSLTLPESDYNQNLGIFQVRVDFLAKNGKTVASSRRPCMLQYRSQPIRLLLTFLKVAPILTGYTSESQNLKINFRGFTEGVVPTSCLRVAIEQRAEFKASAGIPDIYASSLTLESELPFFRKMIWFWKKSLFVWISMTIFTVQLLIALFCCKPILVPRIRLQG